MHSGLSTEAKAGGCPAEFPKLLCKDGNATRRKLRNCGNVIKQVQAETPKLWECYQAGAGGNSEMECY